MRDRRIDPSRRCLLPAEWPLEDQRLWFSACQEGEVLDDPGLAAHWAATTRAAGAKAYGRFINFLECADQSHTGLRPSERITPETIAAFVAHLQNQVTAV